MKFYTSDTLNYVFTVKTGSSLDGLKEVPEVSVLDAIRKKGLSWPDQLTPGHEDYDADFHLVLEKVCFDDERVDYVLDIATCDQVASNNKVIMLSHKVYIGDMFHPVDINDFTPPMGATIFKSTGGPELLHYYVVSIGGELVVVSEEEAKCLDESDIELKRVGKLGSSTFVASPAIASENEIFSLS